MRIYITLLCLFITTITFAQRPESKTVTISGKIVEKGSDLPLEYATVVIIDRNDKIITGGITDTKGYYSIEIASGVYTVQYEFISYKTVKMNNQKLFKDKTLPTIALELDADSLDEVVIRAETTEVQVRLDKKIYNIGKDLTSGGATVSDALNNVPSVTVDVDGTINLRGNENVRILINGKPSAIAGFGSTDALRQLPAESIERVEVITSPSARYDAEGTAGILNIILKKEKTIGLNGSVATSFNYPLGSGITTNINVRTEKFNIFNTTGLRYSDAPGNAFFDNNYFSRTEIDEETGETIIIEPTFNRTTEEREYERLRKGFNTNLGMEYFLTKESSLTATGFLRLGDNNTTTTNTTNDFAPSNTLQFNRVRIEDEDEEDTSYQFSLNYENNLNKNGEKLTIDLQYEKDDETESSLINEQNTFPEVINLLGEKIIAIEDNKEYLAQADYVLPIGENAQFEVGYRGKFDKSITDYTLLEENLAGGFDRNDSISNVFTYNEDTNAFYTQYGNKFGKFSFLLGLRLENTQLKGNSTGEDVATEDDFSINFKNDYTELFPTVNLVYEIGERENVTLGYNRRINRPRHWFINPFPSRSSEANIFQGNPGLNPAFASAFDLGYLKRWKKLTLTSSIYYQYETDAFARVKEDTGETTSNGIPIIRTIPINLSTNQRYGFEAGIMYNPAKWLRLNGSFNIYKFETEGVFNDVDYGTDDTSWFSRFNAKVILPYKVEWQTSGMYRGPRNDSQTESKGMFMMNLALSKDIINDNATVAFNVRDLLNTRKRQSFTQTETFTSDSEFQWRERQFTLSFTYRFNQKKERNRGSRNGGGDEGEDFGG
ncbi:MAG: TonB-dependent receptor [Flavobacteriaceae bacterium]|nr:TonB-dependent receptor [Flavobacteriaceae bacterium]